MRLRCQATEGSDDPFARERSRPRIRATPCHRDQPRLDVEGTVAATGFPAQVWPVMVSWLGILLGTLRSTVRTHRELALENLALRQQLAVWTARQPRPRLTEMDRVFWVLLSRLWTSWRHSLEVVRPETVVGWHRQGFTRYSAWKSRRRSGRPMIATELRDLISRMSRANPLGFAGCSMRSYDRALHAPAPGWTRGLGLGE